MATKIPLTISFSKKVGDKWVSRKVGVAFKSEDGRFLNIKLDVIPTDMSSGHLTAFLEPKELVTQYLSEK